jgi:DNA ligase-1
MASEIKFANVEKDARYIVQPKSTGLWSRYANVIHAPDWWLDQLPNFPVDGELYLGRGTFQELRKIVSRLSPIDDDWKRVQYRILDCPTYDEIFLPGKINNPQYKKTIGLEERLEGPIMSPHLYYEFRYNQMQERVRQNELIIVHQQEKLPLANRLVSDIINDRLLTISSAGGEGLVVRNPVMGWNPIRSKHCLKMKKVKDAEGVVIGYVLGTKRLEGMLGSLRIRWNDKVFDLSGMNDADRVLVEGIHKNKIIAGEYVDFSISDIFPLGTKVTFLYRDLTDSGMPKEARYLRKRTEE